jgi:hypothetical protein
MELPLPFASQLVARNTAMTSESYEQKLQQLEGQQPVFPTFAAAIGLIAAALAFVQFAL